MHCLYLKYSSRAIWEDNLKKVQEHNLQADLGVHTHWLGMNKYADMVKFDWNMFFRKFVWSL